ncbi:MAG: hypothetical protein JXX14_07595 [Deltaproteobacteria bacterium]|nr:hypothetical protein [Deltaproteobacteria bacterium]
MNNKRQHLLQLSARLAIRPVDWRSFRLCQSREKWLHQLLVLSIFLFIAARILSSRIYLDWDEELYLIISKVWMNGQIPYRDIFDHKPPFLYLLYFFLSFGGKTIWTVRLAVTAALVHSLVATSRMFKNTFHRNTVERLVFVSFVLAALSFVGGITSNTESIYIPALLTAFYQLHQKRIGRAAIAGGIALSIKYTTIFDLLGIAMTLILLKNVRSTFMDVLRFLLVSGAIAIAQYLLFGLYFYTNDVDLVKCILLDNLAHAADRLPLWSPSLLFSMCFVFCLVSVPGGVWLFSKRKLHHLRFMTALIIWATLTLLQAMLTGQYYPHYFLPVALPAAIAMTNINLSPTVIRIAAVFLLILGLRIFGGSTLSAYQFEKKVVVVKPYCHFVKEGYYVLDDISVYRICDVSVSERFVFPPFYLDAHFVKLSGSGGTQALRNKIEQGTIPGVILFADSMDLPPDLSDLSYPEVVEIPPLSQ